MNKIKSIKQIIQRFSSNSTGWKFSQIKDANILSIENKRTDQKYQFPYVWLRDNCQCPQCFNAISKSRIMDLKTNLKVKPMHVEIKPIVRPVNAEVPFQGNANSEKTTLREKGIDETAREGDKLELTKRTDTTNNSVHSEETTTSEKRIDEIAREDEKLELIKKTNKTKCLNLSVSVNSEVAKDNQFETKLNNNGNTNDDKVANENKLELAETHETVNIQWEDNHRSQFPVKWLLARNFSADNRAKLDEVYKMKRIPWTAEQFDKVCSKFDFEDVMTDDGNLLKWLECLSTYGVAVITGAGVEVGTLRRLAGRIGFLKRTQYGETFRVEAKPGTSNVAYLSSKLQLHTDLPYYEYKPGLNMLHCLVQAAGAQGRNQLADGLAVIDHLQANRRAVFDILSTTLVDWSDYGQDEGYAFANIHRAPVICLDTRGNLTRINYSQPQRDSVFNAPIHTVAPWYDAMAEFTALLHSPEYLVEFKLAPGEVLTFDNIRLVHGREGYEGERLLEGGYLDWDSVRSRVRVLRAELGSKAG